jgi:hypothetical protein
MEINYFLDTKQSQFDELTTELYNARDVDADDNTPAIAETGEDVLA